MTTNNSLLTPPGEVVDLGSLRLPRSKEFIRYIQGCQPYVELIDVRQIKDAYSEVIVFKLKIERPQLMVHQINAVEPVAVIFFEDSDKQPEVLSLRADFPKVPHLNLRAEEYPRSICLYEQPVEQIRLTWTPADFLRRINYWFSSTARGSLHADDQPLEPLVLSTNCRLILPADFNSAKEDENARPFVLCPIGSTNMVSTLRLIRQEQLAPQKEIKYILASFSCVPQTHGIIHKAPSNLCELNELCLLGGLDLVHQLSEKIRLWLKSDDKGSKFLEAQLVLLINLPKKRYAESSDIQLEQRAFITLSTVQEFGKVLDVVQKNGSSSGYILEPKTPSEADLKTIAMDMLQVHKMITPEFAALLNGTLPNENEIIGIGVGALGSQIFNNLLRSGYGRWTLIDDDTFLPHNCSRHFLGDWAVGLNKADIMAKIGNAIFGDKTLVRSIPENFISPKEHKEKIDEALFKAKLVIDMSASVAVARQLAQSENNVRNLSTFITPNGSSLVVMAEDEPRLTRLDWLEMLHYRAVLNNAELAQTFDSKESHLRYGNSCRDITSELSQDNVAIWAGIASKTIKQIATDSNAALRVFSSNDASGVSIYKPIVTEPIKIKHPCDEWTIQTDDWLIEKLSRIREERLPNETGGILLGVFDTYSRVCSIIDALPSPPDSQEWPISYIRGCTGLEEQLKIVQKQTLEQVTYVGEWHSHPVGASVSPSQDDLKACAWLAEQMNLESLPVNMIIIGDRKKFKLVSASIRN
ncbi:MAG: Mov34/MPN/PAD-1 family protein [Verrucomicrobiales bacterium]|jgi:hypothetical protein|nr:Mov34/MPN/PAD-1 family protein [Verrucomicrobiales bacterium]